jgi:hypothetical protein
LGGIIINLLLMSFVVFIHMVALRILYYLINIFHFVKMIALGILQKFTENAIFIIFTLAQKRLAIITTLVPIVAVVAMAALICLCFFFFCFLSSFLHAFNLSFQIYRTVPAPEAPSLSCRHHCSIRVVLRLHVVTTRLCPLLPS